MNKFIRLHGLNGLEIVSVEAIRNIRSFKSDKQGYESISSIIYIDNIIPYFEIMNDDEEKTVYPPSLASIVCEETVDQITQILRNTTVVE